MPSSLVARPATTAVVAAALPLVLIFAAQTVAAPNFQTPPQPVTAAAPAAAPINVTVDGQPITFTGQGPVTHASGSVLVPLRGVFEKLGATVQYAGETHTITAVKGDTTITLRIGDPNGFVNGMPHPLAVAPMMLNDTTLVPLRFVSEALGAQVKWDGPTQTVLITMPKPIDTSPVAGTAIAVDTGSRNISVHPLTGPDVAVYIIPDAAILSRTGDSAPVGIDLTAIRPGDQVNIKRNDTGNGFAVEASYDEKRGTIKSVDAMPAAGNPKITFADDSVAEIAPGAPSVRGTDPIALGDIQPGQRAILRLNPQTRLATSVLVEIPKVEIASVTQSAGSRLLKSDDSVTVTVNGTPGAKGVFQVPGLVALNEQPLAESTEAPGTYTGTFKVPNGVTIQNGVVTASLSFAGVTSSPGQSKPELNIDSMGPSFADLLPAANANTTDQRIKISGTYKDQDLGSGVDPSGTRLFVNGKDVTSHATVEKGFFLYQPAADLPAGETTVSIVARDMAGNESRQEWTFTVSPMVNPLRVVTLVDVPEGHPLAAGDTLKVRAEAPPGGSARFMVGKMGVIARPMAEESPGIYTGSYTVQKGDSLTKEPVTAYYMPAGGDKESSLAAIQTVSIQAGAPRIPTIDLPAANQAVGPFVVIQGRGTPNTKIRLNITYNGKVIIFQTSSGGELSKTLITVDNDGNWKSDTILLNTSRDLNGVTFTAEAVTVANDGDVSEPAKVQFKK